MKENKIYDLASWKPNHPAGTLYSLDEGTGKVTAKFPNGKEEHFILLKHRSAIN